jgi:hypothetical protein
MIGRDRRSHIEVGDVVTPGIEDVADAVAHRIATASSSRNSSSTALERVETEECPVRR